MCVWGGGGLISFVVVIVGRVLGQTGLWGGGGLALWWWRGG